MRRSLFLIILYLFVGQVVLADDTGPEETAAPAGTLRVGKNLTYKRGTAKAKEQFVEFPYTHTTNSRECWAWVVHEGQGLRVYFKKDEIEGKKDESDDLTFQDFDMDHPFAKVVDQIKLDGLLNVYQELKKSKKLEDEDWQVLSGDSAVYKKFFKNSEGRHYCIVAVHDINTKKISQPIILSFKRSKQGPMATLVSPQGTMASTAQQVNPDANLGTYHVFRYLESRKGF
jgi:hypothetical protein